MTVDKSSRTKGLSNNSNSKDFLDSFQTTLNNLFSNQADLNQVNLSRGVPPYVLRSARSSSPLSTFIPEEYGGRGGTIAEGLAIMDIASYHSLALSLLLGINGGLFLQPVSKYGTNTLKENILPGVLSDKKLGGLMITEPDYGTDALKMETSYQQHETESYRIRGTKHWAGLTGWADYWLVAARENKGENRLSRDIDLFVCRGDDGVEVEELYENLGLQMLPYGLNKIDAEVPTAYRLSPESSGIRMMQDLLHRSRFQFPGMGMGFLRRTLDEAITHCKNRFVGGKNIFEYDQVQRRLAEIQASRSVCSAMCVYTAENAGIDQNLHEETVAANSIKAVITDLMQDASQSLLQLVGAEGYRKDHIAGRQMIDSRPFQIFEGSNDVLYDQIARGIIKKINRSETNNLFEFLSDYELTTRAANNFEDALDFSLKDSLSQRKMVDLGHAIGRIISIDFVKRLGERGFPDELVKNCTEVLKGWTNEKLLAKGDREQPTAVETQPSHNWLQYVDTYSS